MKMEAKAACSAPAILTKTALQNGAADCTYNARKSRLPFVSTHKKKMTKKDERSSDMVFKRSKSTATPRRGIRFFDEKCVEDYSPNRRRFWSFLYMSKQSAARKSDKHVKNLNFTSPSNVGSSSSVNANGGTVRSRERKREDFMAVDENGSSHDSNEAAFDRKVSRSRSVGCGSRSFSGDFFERISTGFGDCTLRRVESQREGKPKMQSLRCKNGGGDSGEVCIRQRVKCGGIFGGFVLTSSSSDTNVGGKSMSALGHHLSHGRSKSWGWAFASPMRAFGKSYAVKRDAALTKNAAAPNLTAIPSLLAVGG
ncbi:hypothetical protein C2S51_013932 [Perilla frutescens var. frutescens]|nr:hypothetical protein C2S51_013932 [Perilla frutescens var. frutescens]